MRSATLVARGLVHYWRTNAAVVAGVGVAVSALAGALIVGDSVRASLRELVLHRLGRADHAVSAGRFFREALAEELASRPGFAGRFTAACPLIVLDGVVTHEESGRRAAGLAVYGIDERFWAFHDRADPGLTASEALVSESLVSELASTSGSTLLLRVEQPSAIPRSSLFGRKGDVGRTLRLRLRAVRPASDLGEFSLRPQQQAVRAVFVPLRLLQRTLKLEGRVNTVLVAERRPESQAVGPALVSLVKEAYTLEDLGLRLRVLEARGALLLESESALLGEAAEEAARAAAQKVGLRSSPVLTYLANAMRAGKREIPYSLVTALDREDLSTLSEGHPPEPAGSPGGEAAAPILLNGWAARDLGVRRGATVSLEYYLWEEQGRLVTRTASFQLAAVLPLAGAALDRDLTPEYPGITDSLHVSDWDPPFPIDIRRIRPRDEEYWERYRTTPKAFMPLEAGQALWAHRLGRLTSLRLWSGEIGPPAEAREAFEKALLTELDPQRMGLSVEPVRAQGLEASRGATDFGAYFAYFSSFAVGAALLLAALFFRLGLEQRLREVGLLRALGYPPARLRALFVAEGAALALLGSLLGMAGAAGYAGLMVLGLRTWWIDAVGTRELALHLSPASLALGALGGAVAALACIVVTLRGLRRVSPRALLAGVRSDFTSEAAGRRGALSLAAAAGLSSALLLAGTLAGRVSEVPGFFGSGLLLLAALLAFQWRWLSARKRRPLTGGGAQGLLRLGFRNASDRPGRSLLAVALIASATFVIVAVGVFRREAGATVQDRRSGSGGYTFLAESLLPLHYDLNTIEGREALNLADGPALEGVAFARFRLRPGDDASCLNLYQPLNPRVLGVPTDLIREGRFSFQASLARTPEERANPWLLLARDEPDGAIPVIADANSMTYVLHRRLGDELLLHPTGARPLRLRIVGALRDSLFQGELLMSEGHFQRAFPHVEGYRFLLIEAAPERTAELTALLESRLADFGLDVLPAEERLARFHRVENTYIATFQALGGLGLLLGTLGLAAVLLRNALERRREMALLRAAGYRRGHLTLLMTAENALLLVLGLATGTACALVAIAPAAASRGGQLPVGPLAALLAAVALAGALISSLAVTALHRSPVRKALSPE